MTPKEYMRVLEVIENEGFDYTFASYSSFADIHDPDFHKLRRAYREARKALSDYVGADE